MTQNTITVMVQNFSGIEAGIEPHYRAVNIELTDEQVKKLKLNDCETYGNIAININNSEAKEEFNQWLKGSQIK